MLPVSESDFDFNLPQGFDIENAATSNGKEAPHTNTVQDDTQHQDPSNVPQHFEKNSYHHYSDGPMNDVLQTSGGDRYLKNGAQSNEEQPLKYQSLPRDISDDDGVAEAFDRSWISHQARRSRPKVKKSPRRDETDGDDEANPRIKKPRQSLFCGPEPRDEKVDNQNYSMNQDDDMDESRTLKQGIGRRMSSLNLERQDQEGSPLDRPFYLGFGATSGRDSLSPRASPTPSEDSISIPADDQPAYELRQNIERKKAFTYIDTDKSGNFDPLQEARLKMLKLQKVKAAKAAQKRKGKKRATKKHVMKLIVRLPFKAFGNVRNYTNDEDNWPDSWSDLDSEFEREHQEYREFYRQNTPGYEVQVPVEDPGGDLDDLTGYPAARGCRSCRKHELSCSMTGGGIYPCTRCDEADLCCEPIIQAPVKGRCKQCCDLEYDPCSFEYDPNMTVCDSCTEKDTVCEALPPDGYRAERIIIDELIYSKDRPHLACTVCRKDKKRCSLKTKSEQPPCNYCKKNNLGCVFFDVPKSESRKTTSNNKRVLRPTDADAPKVSMPGSDYFTAEDLADMNRRDGETSDDGESPEGLEMEDGLGHKGLLTKIMTCFSHPIQFGGLLDNTADCNFCELPTYGFVGLFEREAHVICWYSGLGYTELGGGHAENNGATTMCQTCTISRAQIIACTQHEMRRVDANDIGPGFHDAFPDLLMAAEEGIQNIQHQLQRWCSMCFAPATFVCRMRQPSLFANEGAEEDIDGCGLRLCDSCEAKLREVFNGDSSVMAATLDHEPKAKAEDEDVDGQVVRADVGFLSREGLLMKSLEHEANQVNF